MRHLRMRSGGTLVLAIGLLAIVRPCYSAEIETAKDADTGWRVLTLKEGDLAVQVVPHAGANVDSIRFKGIELLKQPKTLKDLPGFMYGVPVLYPMPNRVRGGAFTFEGQKYSFAPNNDGNFLHGLVNNAPWKIGPSTTQSASGKDESAIVRLRCDFSPGTEPYRMLPWPHTLELTITVKKDTLRWTYTVDNRNGDKPIPFGFALHPWFLYQGAGKIRS